MTSLDATTIWTIAGITLIIGEMLTGGFYLLFLALGCFAAALSASFAMSYPTQGVVCALVAVAGVLTLRKSMQKKFLKSISLQADIGREIQVDQAIPPHKQTRTTYQGTSWLATNLSAEELKQGERVVIVGIDGNVLLIRKIH